MLMATLDIGETLSATSATTTPVTGPVDIIDCRVNGTEKPESISPRRKSTRASAVRAAERMRGENIENNENIDDTDEVDTATLPLTYGTAVGSFEHGLQDEGENQPKKKRRLAQDLCLDQTDVHFAIQLDSDGDAVALSDDSIISSVNDEDMAQIRKAFEKAQLKDLTEEQRRERRLMVQQLESELRLEEAKLLMLKKLRMSQKMPVNARDVGASNTTHNNAVNMNTAAKQPAATNMASRVHAPNQRASPSVQKVQQQQQMHRQSPAPTAHSSTKQFTPAPSSQASVAQQSARHTPTLQQQQQQQTPRASHMTEAQRTEAKLKIVVNQKTSMRQQLEKTLLALPPPKAPADEPFFVPNFNQPDFVFYVGLDMAVQKVLKDRSYVNPKRFEVWTCDECATDFTPFWRAVKVEETGPDEPSNWRRLCEQCARAASKKQVKDEHNNRIKQAIEKAQKQEEEFEQQIRENKVDWVALGLPPAAPPPPPPQPQVQQHHQQHRISTPRQTNSGPSSARATPPTAHRSTQPRGGGSSSASSNAAAAVNAAMRQQQQQLAAGLQAMQQAAARQSQQNTAAAAAASSSHHSNAAAQAAAIAALQNSAALFGNSLMGAWNPALARASPQMAQMAMAALASQTQGVHGFSALLNSMAPNANAPGDFLRQLQQLQQQQTQQAMAQLQRKMQQGNRK